ncbi:MAG TPA: alanyl-tRNA editing protein [Gemmatimonadales bacterium]|jgi:alanyl-tRNA synthetase|nr:alanyl-tRNA editing protein [Gemmatimonadales bacterium]
MTDRLYYTDAYLTSFEATVLELADGGRRAYLDRTAFYPASGGQPCDRGWLDEIEVVDVVDEGERIAHLLASAVAEGPVRGRIDLPRRFDHMQQHTGQHLLSAILAELFGWQTLSVHFGRESATLDLDAESAGHEQIVAAEIRANEVVVENRPVRVSFEEASTAGGLRKPAARAGTLRIVSIERLDRSACGGTHVQATGEIGSILIRKVERVKQHTRLEFLCGGRAVRAARSDLDLLTRIATLHSALAEEVPALVAAQRAELKQAVAARRELEQELSRYRARELYQAARLRPDGIRVTLVREETGTAERLRPLAQAFGALPRTLFIGVVEDPPTILLASSEDSGIDAGRTLRAELERVGGRGGGSVRLAQGSGKDREGLEAVVGALAAPTG